MGGQKTPLISSEKCCAALRRAGFEPRKASGSHQTWSKVTPERTYVTVVVLAKRELSRGTLEDIVENAGMTMEEFLRFVR